MRIFIARMDGCPCGSLPQYLAGWRKALRFYDCEKTGRKRVVRFVPKLSRPQFRNRLLVSALFDMLGSLYIVFASNSAAFHGNQSVHSFVVNPIETMFIRIEGGQ